MYFKQDKKKYSLTFIMARKFIGIVKESQNQTVSINTKPTGIIGCSILRDGRQRTEKTWNSSGPWKA